MAIFNGHICNQRKYCPLLQNKTEEMDPNIREVCVETLKVEASPKPIPPRKSRKSGLLQPGDFLVQDSSAGVQSGPSTPIRCVGGVSSRQQASDDYLHFL